MELTTDSIVKRVYDEIKSLVVSYTFKPGERINEVELARRLGVSRTPLREALNRLNTEGLLTTLSGKGFFCRDLDEQEIFSLYELRKVIEVQGIKLAVERATQQEISALIAFLNETSPGSSALSTVELVELDETFHRRLLEMAGNIEMLRVLDNVNARIRFVRWVDIDTSDRRHEVPTEHHAIAAALAARDVELAQSLLEKHIDTRKGMIGRFIKEAYAKIYMEGGMRS